MDIPPQIGVVVAVVVVVQAALCVIILTGEAQAQGCLCAVTIRVAIGPCCPKRIAIPALDGIAIIIARAARGVQMVSVDIGDLCGAGAAAWINLARDFRDRRPGFMHYWGQIYSSA